MSGSIESKPLLAPRIPPSGPEVGFADDATAEAWVLHAAGKEHLIDVPLNVARKIIVVDALDYHITMQEKLALIAWGLWSVSGKVGDISQYLGVSGYARINPLLNLVQDNTQSARSNIKLGDCMKEVSGVENVLKSIDKLPGDSDNRDRLKAVAEEILKLQGDGFANEQIMKRRAAIQAIVKSRLSPGIQFRPPAL
jgi:hypothetical protein